MCTEEKRPSCSLRVKISSASCFVLSVSCFFVCFFVVVFCFCFLLLVFFVVFFVCFFENNDNDDD